MTKVFINGEFIDQNEAKVSYDLVMEFMKYIRAYDGKLFTVTEHFERFIRSASEIQLDLGYTVEELIDVVRELLKVNNIQNGGIYIQATRGVAPRNHSFPTQK